MHVLELLLSSVHTYLNKISTQVLQYIVSTIQIYSNTVSIQVSCIHSTYI